MLFWFWWPPAWQISFHRYTWWKGNTSAQLFVTLSCSSLAACLLYPSPQLKGQYSTCQICLRIWMMEEIDKNDDGIVLYMKLGWETQSSEEKKIHSTTCRFQRRFLIMIFSRPFRKIEMMVFALSCFLSTTTGKCIVEWTLLWFEHNCDPLNRDCSKKMMDTMCWEQAC